MNQLKPVLIEDFNEIKVHLVYSTVLMRRHLHSCLYSQTKKIINIVKNLWIMEENKEAVQLTSSGKDG